MTQSLVIAKKALRWTIYGVITGVLSLVATVLLHDKVDGWLNSFFHKQLALGGIYESQTSGKHYEFVMSASGSHLDLYLINSNGQKVLVGAGSIKDNDPTSVGDEIITIDMQVELSDGGKRKAVLVLQPSADGNTLAGSYTGADRQEVGRLFFFRLIAG